MLFASQGRDGFLEDKLTFIDFETTGFKENRALSLAIVHYENGVRAFEKYFLINPKALIEQGAVRVHGIKYEDIRYKQGFEEIWEAIRPYIEGNLVVAHNARYDLRVLKGELDRYNLNCGEFRSYCTYESAKALRLPVNNYKLDTVCRYFGINLEDHHNALADTIACEKVYFNLRSMDGKGYYAYNRSIMSAE
jgi:DNA polymerase-3 subunit epsilon